MTPKLLRAFAILIALAAIIDPRVTSERPVKPEIAIVAADATRDSALADRVARELDGKYTVIRAPFASAAATVIAGNQVPGVWHLRSRTTSHASSLPASPVFGVFHDDREARVTIESVHAATRAAYDARVPVTAVVRAHASHGQRLTVSLRAGDVIVDRTTRVVANDSTSNTVTLSYVPTAFGAVPLRIEAELDGGRRTANADIMLSIDPRRWGVLFFDRRPSWMSTFVRRAVERDARFVVTSRTVTSREISSDAGRPPASLADLAPLALYDAVVVGAPEALTARDVEGLDAFMRRRGGSVVLLFDHRAGGAYERLTASGAWSAATERERTSVHMRADPVFPSSRLPGDADSAGLNATELAWPAQMPAGARVIAVSATRPVVWTSAIGAGTLTVSGAFDAWRYRDTSAHAFDAFWQSIVARAVTASPPAVELSVSDAIITPGGPVSLDVTVRDGALAFGAPGTTVRATASAFMELVAGASATGASAPGASAPGASATNRIPVRLWPAGSAGRFTGTVSAPSTPGTYRVIATGNAGRAERQLVVSDHVARATPDERDLVTALANSRGGAAAPVSELDGITRAIARAVQSPSRRETWYPMRSVWWIVPFALALGAEWWWRRRRGLA